MGRIIVIEDNPVFRDHVCGMLEKAGYKTRTAYDCAGARRLLEELDDGDIIVSDLRLPDAGKHGREPARQREETDGTAAGKPARGLRAQPSGYRKTGADGTEGPEAVVPHCPVMTTGDCLYMKRSGRPYFFQ